MHLAPPLLESLREQGYETPTPIQALAIRPIMKGHDLLGIAQTGTGKTAAFALPILHRLMTTRSPLTSAPAAPVATPAGADGAHAPHARRGKRTSDWPVRALILSPTRELASQILESFETYGRHSGLKATAIFGGVRQGPQERALRAGVDIVVAAPGRLIDLMEQRLVDISNVEVFVLDEADRMLDMGFMPAVKRIAGNIPRTRQTLLFSATMLPEVEELTQRLLRDPVRVEVARTAASAPKIRQSLYHLSRYAKPALLQRLLDDPGVKRAVVFVKTKRGADKVCTRLVLAGVQAAAIHGDKAQNQRERALDAFIDGTVRVLVATDVAARGLDVEGVTHVFNHDLPMEPEAYVHRIGRTGRAGAAGEAIAFCAPEERDLLRDVERLLGKPIPVLPTPSDLPTPPPLPPGESDGDRDGGRGYGRSSGNARGGHGGGGYGGGRPGGGAGPRTSGGYPRSASGGSSHGGSSHGGSGGGSAGTGGAQARGFGRMGKGAGRRGR